MSTSSSFTASAIRARLAFDVERLKSAAERLATLERALHHLQENLEVRATDLSGQATVAGRPESSEDGEVSVRYAQAHATATLARRAKMGEILAKSGHLSLIATMAVNRWVSALEQNATTPTSDAVIKGHIDAGRLAHRMLVTLRPRDQLRSGCGQLVSAVVVAELVHPSNQAFVAEQIEEGLHRGLLARSVRTESDVIEAASRALRAGAKLLESMANRVAPALESLTQEAEEVEAAVEAALRTTPFPKR